MARLMDQISNDAAALEAYYLNGRYGDFPQALPLDQGYRRRDELIHEIESALETGARQADFAPGESRYRLCNPSEFEMYLETVNEYHELLAIADAATDIDELVAYAEAQVAWRETVWQEKPLCEFFWELGFDMSRVTEDIFVWKALELAGLSDSENPYAEPIRLNRLLIQSLEDYMRRVVERERAETGAATQAFPDMPRCPADLLNAELERLHSYAEAGASEIQTLDELLRFSLEQMAWRAENIANVPLCAEQLEIQALLIQLNGDFVARAGLNLAAVPADENPFLRLPGDQERVDALSYSSERPASDRKQARACRDAEMRDALSEDTAEYSYMLNAIRQASVIENFIAYLEDQIAWRDALWGELTLCAEVIELGLLMQKIHSGYASFLALHYAGATPEQNPFHPQIQADRAALQALTMAILQGANTDEPVADQSAGLPTCGNKAMQALIDSVIAYQNDLGSGSLNTLDELLAYSRVLMNWRESSLARLPRCTDAIKARILLAQLTGDFVARSALDIAGVAAAENPYLRLPSDRKRLEAVGLSMLNADRADAASEFELPACTQSEIDQLSDVIGLYLDSLGGDVFPNPYEQVTAYSDAFLTWRAEGLSGLPPCADGVEFGFALNEMSGDIATLVALSSAGADTDEIPQMRGAAKAFETITEIIERLGI